MGENGEIKRWKKIEKKSDRNATLSEPTRRLFERKEIQKWMQIEEQAYLHSISTRQREMTLK